MFWSNLVEAAYSTFYNNPGNNPNPQPPAFPPGWTYVATLQVDLQLLGTYYFIGWILRGSSGQYAIVYQAPKTSNGSTMATRMTPSARR